MSNPISNTRRGDVTRWTNTLIPTTREAPADAEMPSHILLTRAGCIRKLAAGVYDYLPLGWRSLGKISAIVREEMNAAGASELHLPVFEPLELMKETGRAEDYGDDLFRLTDRHGREMALAPTHEEPIVELTGGSITSYKQLPLTLYQVQTKMRDEVRPRSGLLRGREFIMKDAYSFHLEIEGAGGLNETYDRMYTAYSNIFTRCGLDFTVVEAEAGPIGGSASHEFMVNCASGEDKILRCPESGYAANVEKAEIGDRPWSFDGPSDAPALEKVHTPNMPGIDGVAEFLGVEPSGMLKTVVFEVVEAPEGDETEWVLATVRGDHDVNEGKVRDACGCKVALANDKRAREAGFAIGYVSPAVLRTSSLRKAQLFVDPDAAVGDRPWATGADEKDHHVRSFIWSREMGERLADAKVTDIRNAEEGDPSPRAPGVKLVVQRGIEVGHIFKLGSKYSDAMGFEVMDRDQKRRSVIMGCYGIGVSRTLAASVEMSHDENGIVWPLAIAPYHVLITVMKPNNDDQVNHANRIADDLAAEGFDVLIDDRAERPGVKFNDADLIGIPLRITIGDKALAENSVEFKKRTDDGKTGLTPIDGIVETCLGAI